MKADRRPTMLKIDSGAEPVPVRPIMKWAGGKGQLLGELRARVPENYGKYIEPFFGGGALYFSLLPQNAVIADINPELINLYTAVRDQVTEVIRYLSFYKNEKEYFLEVRAQDWFAMGSAEAAARTIYLNRTCFNGLYRVNRSGGFNVPFGNYKNPKILDASNLLAASDALQSAEIILGDYKDVLKRYAEPGDFIFLDPPYVPVSKYSDFKRYTKEQFYEQDHIELAREVSRLQKLGCITVLTNSNHPLVHDLYAEYDVEVVKTKRRIAANAKRRSGEDVIVDILPLARERTL